ncbi:MAG TPA: universal stress protein [Burkholderiales bacterium]|nr:universal stress protein [Burkholderiales bacterium]
MYKRILVPIDGSSSSRRGLREAIRLAKNQKARLCLLHVVEELFIAQTGEAVIFAEDMFKAMRASGRAILSRAAAAARKRGVRARTVLVESIAMPAADVIVREARKWKADLIVIGTHGRRGLRRVVMGSDAEQVVRNAPAPVLLIRAAAR